MNFEAFVSKVDAVVGGDEAEEMIGSAKKPNSRS